MARTASADPVAFSADEDSSAVSVVNATNGTLRATISVADGFPRAPKDLALDSKSGRVFVAADGQLISFDGRLPDGRGLHRVATRPEGSGVAIDEVGRRVFLSHEQFEPGQTYGIVTEYSIANPAQPTFVAEHLVPGAVDLRKIAWDARYYRLYVVSDSGAVARTGQGNRTFAQVSGVMSGGEGGILADPHTGGVWITLRGSTTGRLIRITEPGAVLSYTLPTGYRDPRGLAWDVSVAGTILIAVDDENEIIRFTPSTGAFQSVMDTDPRPQDVGALAGMRVSVNRVASGANGTMWKNGMPMVTIGLKPVAVLLHDLPRLTADPPQKTFCYQSTGDTGEQTFTIQNTRLDRAQMDLLPVAIGGSNPANYTLVGTNTCSSQRLQWGQTCTFRVRFTAGGPSIQPPPPFGGTWASASWPAEAIVSGTNNSGTTRIRLSASLNLNSCYNLPPLIPAGSSFSFP